MVTRLSSALAWPPLAHTVPAYWRIDRNRGGEGWGEGGEGVVVLVAVVAEVMVVVVGWVHCLERLMVENNRDTQRKRSTSTRKLKE